MVGGGGLWPAEGQMVNDMTGLFFFQAGGHAALIKSDLPITSCPGRGWRRELMEDVTNHKSSAATMPTTSVCCL